MMKSLHLLLGRNPLYSLLAKAGEKSILCFQDQHEGSRMGAGPASASTSQDSNPGQVRKKVSRPSDKMGGKLNFPCGFVTFCEKP